MKKKVQTAFRLFQQAIDDLDALIAVQPDWLTDVAPGPMQDRTDVVERLIFSAMLRIARKDKSADLRKQKLTK